MKFLPFLWLYGARRSLKRNGLPPVSRNDARRDCSKRGDVVLECFAVAGSTTIAAEITGRVARLVEYDPAYCDLIINRFERFTGARATLMTTCQTFEEVSLQRSTEIGGAA